MSKKTFVIVLPRVHREFIITDREPHVGDLISSRHPGLFDAEVNEGTPEAPHTLQKAMWLLDRPAAWFASLVRRGALKAYRIDGQIAFEHRALRELLAEGWTDEPTEDWCVRVESIGRGAGDVDAVIHTRALLAENCLEDHRQLSLAF